MKKQDDIKKQQAIRHAQTASVAVGMVDMTGITALFVMLAKETLRVLFEEVGKFIIFPISAISSIIQAILAWRQAQLNGFKTHTVVQAAIETVAAVAVTTAVGIGLFATATIAAVAPIIFTVILSAKSLFHATSAIYYAGKSAAASDLVKKAEWRNRSKENAIQSFSLALATAAVATVLVLGKIALAGLGIAAGTFSLLALGSKARSLYKNRNSGYQAVADEKQAADLERNDNPADVHGNTSGIYQGLRARAAGSSSDGDYDVAAGDNADFVGGRGNQGGMFAAGWGVTTDIESEPRPRGSGAFNV